MNKLLLFTSFYFLFTFGASSQQPFAPPGAVWHYDFSAVSSGGFIKIEYISDTVIQSVICKHLQITQYAWFLIDPVTYGHSINQLPSKFIYQNADTVFWFTNNL